MVIKIIGVLLLMIHYGFCLDVTNCTNSSKTFLSFPPNPEMKFYLFTRKNFLNEQKIIINKKWTLTKSNFNSSWPVRILVHGWKNDFFTCFNKYVKDAYLNKDHFNVFVVDWGDWAQNDNYVEILPYIYGDLGYILAQFIDFLHIIGKVLYDKIYLIGHGMGAHLCGTAGWNLNENQVNTIFGLDPSSAGFQNAEISKRLDPSDAKYVEQIQTNMGEIGYSGFIGHAAFYPNYGRIQPYCTRYEKTNPNCAHNAAYWYFAESINTETGFCSQPCPFYMKLFLGIACPTLTCTNRKNFLMGGEPSKPKAGTFNLRTNSFPNFAVCNCLAKLFGLNIDEEGQSL